MKWRLAQSDGPLHIPAVKTCETPDLAPVRRSRLGKKVRPCKVIANPLANKVYWEKVYWEKLYWESG